RVSRQLTLWSLVSCQVARFDPYLPLAVDQTRWLFEADLELLLEIYFEKYYFVIL
uniref:Uncharacterized protein n=1 Tax=Oryza brachyantha TaxID=4533 RepID=J3LDQ4_ORYBR